MGRCRTGRPDGDPCRPSVAVQPAQRHGERQLQHQADRYPRADRRCGRLVRHEVRRAARIRAGRMGGAQAGPAGALDLRTHRGFPHRRAGARNAHHGRAGPRCRSQIHRAEAALGRQSRRLRDRPLRLAGRQYRRHRRRLSYPRDVRRGVRHPDQHRADRRLSRCRAAGGDLHDRAHHRCRRARTRHQPVRTAADQPDPARGDAVQDRAHLHLRLRRVRRQHAAGRGTGGTRRLRGAARGGRDRAANCAASACATASRSPAVRSCVRRRISPLCASPRTAR